MADLNLSLNIGAQVSSAVQGLKSVSSEIQKINGINLRRASASITSFGRSVEATGRGLSSFIGTAAVGGFFAKIISDASEAEETVNKFNVVFAQSADAAGAAARNLADNFGLSTQAAQGLLGDTGDLLTGFGFASDAALELSNGVQELAVDLASFTNFSGGAEGASAALTKALLGERESVKALGISIQEADVQAKVLELTQQGLTFETERQAKAYATLQIAIGQSQNAIGDFARSQSSFANQSRILQAQLSNLSVSLGNLLLPAATRLTTALVAVVDTLNNLNPAFQGIALGAAAFVGFIGPALVILGKLIQVLGVATQALVAFSARLLSLARIIGVQFVRALALVLSPIGLIVTGLTALAAAVVFSAQRFFILRDAGVGVFDAIKIVLIDLLDFINGAFVSAINGAANLAIGAVNTIRTALGQTEIPPVNVEGFNQSLDGLRQGILDRVGIKNEDIPKTGIENFITDIRERIGSGLGFLQENIQSTFNPSNFTLGSQVDGVKASVDGLNNSLSKTNTESTAFQKKLGEVKVPSPEEIGVSAVQNAVGGLTQGLFAIGQGTESASEAFKSFASNFLQQIGQMIVQAALLRAIQTGLGTAGGGAAPAPAGAATGGLVSGGQITQRFAEGGPVIGPGSATSDSIMARLSNGEFVSDARTVSTFGVDFFKNLKSLARGGFGNFTPQFAGSARFAEGGFVGTRGSDMTTANQDSMARSMDIQIVNNSSSEARVTRVEQDTDGRSDAIKIFLDDLKVNGSASRAMQSAFGLKRKGFK